MNSQERRNRYLSYADGIGYSLMVGLGESYIPAFVIALGLGAVHAGLITTVPMLAGGMLQLLTPRFLHRIGSYKTWIVILVSLQTLCFIPLIIFAEQHHASVSLLYGTLIVYWAVALSSGTVWKNWIEQMIPSLDLFLANRQRILQAITLMAFILASMWLNLGQQLGQEMIVFQILFVVALCARLISLVMQLNHSEKGVIEHPLRAHNWRMNLKKYFSGPYRKLLLFVITMKASVYIAAPYFNPYMIEHLALNYHQYMILIASSSFAKITIYTFYKKNLIRGQPKLILLGSGMGISLLPALWLVNQNFFYLILLQILAGILWEIFELTILLLYFHQIPRHERVEILSIHVFFDSLAICLGSLLGAFLFLAPFAQDHYQLLFLVSSFFRILSLLILANVSWPKLKWITLPRRVLGLRPSRGQEEQILFPSNALSNSKK